jgi:hypothetical protein
LKLPAAHAWHAPALAAVAPCSVCAGGHASQFLHEAEPALLYAPSAQGLHEGWATASWYVPAAHATQVCEWSKWHVVLFKIG